MNALFLSLSPVTLFLATAALGAVVACVASALEAGWQRQRTSARRIQLHLRGGVPRASVGAPVPNNDPHSGVGRLETLLAEAEVTVDRRKLLTGLGISGLVVCVALLATTGLPAVAVGGGVGLPMVVGWIYLVRRRDAARRRLVDQVPMALEAISNAMRAGSTLPQAVAQAAEELPAPIAPLLRMATALYRVGRPLEDVLTDLQKHVKLPVMEFAVSAMLVNRQTGGNLAPLLLDAAELIREDLRLQRDLQAATAQVRLSAQLVGLLPLLLLGALAVLNPSSLAPFFASLAGILMLVAAGLLDVVGFVLVLRVSRVDF